MEIIPKQGPKIPPWVDILFYLSVILLIFTFVSYFAVNHFIKKSQDTLADLEKTLASEISEKASLKKEILTYEKKINDFSRLISVHGKASNVFAFIEEQCHPNIWFNNFILDAEGEKLFLTGEAQDFQSLGQQMLIFREENDVIKSVELGDVSLKKEGGISFKLTFLLDPSIFTMK